MLPYPAMSHDNPAGDLHGDHPARDVLGVPSAATTTTWTKVRRRRDASIDVPAVTKQTYSVDGPEGDHSERSLHHLKAHG